MYLRLVNKVFTENQQCAYHLQGCVVLQKYRAVLLSLFLEVCEVLDQVGFFSRLIAVACEH